MSLPFIFLYLYLFHQMGMGWGLCIICVYVCDPACVRYKAGARGSGDSSVVRASDS